MTLKLSLSVVTIAGLVVLDAFNFKVIVCVPILPVADVKADLLIKTPIPSLVASTVNKLVPEPIEVVWSAEVVLNNEDAQIFVVEQACLFTKIQTASQLDGPVVTRQLFSHEIVKLMVLLEALKLVLPIFKLFAKEIFDTNMNKKMMIIFFIINNFKNLKTSYPSST